MHPRKLHAKPVRRSPVNALDLVRSKLENVKRIVVLAGGDLSSETTVRSSEFTTDGDNPHGVSAPDDAQSTSEASDSQPDIAGLSHAHLALGSFALPHVRNSIAVESYLTIITCNGDGRIKRAIEHFFSMFGLEVPSSDGDVSKRVHRDPLLIELSTRRRYNEEQMRIFGPEDGCGSEEEQLQTASRIISNADLLLIAGCLSDVEFFARDIARLKERYGTTVAVFASEGATNIGQLQPDHVFADPLSVVFPQLFAMNPRSLWFDDGSLRIFYPGVTITATPNGGLSTCYADPMNAVPRHSRAFAVSCGPFVPRPALSRAEIMAISDEDIVRLCQNSPNLTDTTVTRTFPVRPVYVLAENVLVKVGGFGAAHAPEAAAMTLVRQQTSIPVPEMYRFFVHGSRSYLVMEYVHGETLDHCWDDLTSWEKIQVSVVLRDYVKQMRRIRTPQIDKQIPGPITEDLSRPIRCELPALGECRAGPFFSYAELRDWMNGRLRVSQQMQRYRYGGQAFDDSESLVFTHGDLFLRNLILGNDQRLWLIDFGCAGVYPRWFEVYGMLERTLIYPQPKLWTWTRKFAAGPYEEQERYICACQEAMTLGTLWPDPGPEELERELSSLGL